MTAAAPARTSRPAKPRRSPTILIGIAAFLVITWLALSEEFGIGFDLIELIEDIARGAPILYADADNPAKRGLLQPNWGFVERTFPPMIETFQIAILGAFIGCSIALPVSFMASRVTARNAIVLGITRTLLSIVRAIPDILWALLFVAAVGIGVLPGVLALIFFNIGVVVKLLSETIDGVDPGPIEAAKASGATGVQSVRWAVLPQVLPNYVAYALYAFELNVRASAVLGVVGAGGIGNMLFTQYRFFNWSNVSLIVVELFVLVMLIEVVSIQLRRRLV